MNTLGRSDNFSKLIQTLFSDGMVGSYVAESNGHAGAPACELREDEKSFYLNLEMPGVAKDKIKIEQHEQLLTVGGEKKESLKLGKLLYEESSVGKFSRSFELPKHVDSSKIEASFEDGILMITLPKVEVAKPREIKIGQKTSTTFFDKLVKGDRQDAQWVS